MPQKRRLEKNLEEQCLKHATQRGCQLWKLKIPGKAGIPDRLLLTPTGRAIFIELKRDALSTPRPVQHAWIRKLSEMGFKATVVYTYEAFVELCP